MRVSHILTFVFVVVCSAPALAQDVSPKDDVTIPGWVWVIVVAGAVLIGFGITLGVFKGQLTRAVADIAKVDADLTKHADADGEKYAPIETVRLLAVEKASREYVDGIQKGFDSKFDLVLGQLGTMKNDMDRQFMFLREELRGRHTAFAAGDDSDKTPTGRTKR